MLSDMLRLPASPGLLQCIQQLATALQFLRRAHLPQAWEPAPARHVGAVLGAINGFHERCMTSEKKPCMSNPNKQNSCNSARDVQMPTASLHLQS